MAVRDVLVLPEPAATLWTTTGRDIIDVVRAHLPEKTAYKIGGGTVLARGRGRPPRGRHGGSARRAGAVCGYLRAGGRARGAGPQGRALRVLDIEWSGPDRLTARTTTMDGTMRSETLDATTRETLLDDLEERGLRAWLDHERPGVEKHILQRVEETRDRRQLPVHEETPR